MIERNILWILIVSFFVKALIGGLLPLSPDEAYYWIWSHHLQLSYFDHPPFVSWLFLLGQPLESLGSFVRLPGMIMGHLTLLLWILILKEYFSSQQLMTFTLLGLLMPFLGPAGLIITPDTPMMFFWAACLLCMQKLMKSEDWRMALALGLCFGLGFSSKYPIVLILPVLLAWLIGEKGIHRKTLSWVGIGALGAIATSFPVWFWNLTNSMESFGFQLNHGFGGTSFKIKYPIHYLTAQIGLIFPTVLYFAWKGRKQAPFWLRWAAIFPLAFFGFSSLFSYAEANWPIAAHPAFLALAAFTIDTSVWKKITAGIWGLVLALVISEALFSWIPSTGVRLKTRVLHKYDAVAEHTRDLSPVFARTYQMASMVSFINGNHIYKLRGMNRRDFFDSMEKSLPTKKEFYLVTKTNENLPVHLQDNYTILRREPIDDNFDLAFVRSEEP